MNTAKSYRLHEAVLNSNYKVVEELSSICDPNELDNLGHTCLHWAVFRGDLEMVELLLNVGVSPNIFSADGVTPKWRANDFGLTEIEDVLTKFGGKISTNNNFDRTSFQIFNNDVLGQSLPKNEEE